MLITPRRVGIEVNEGKTEYLVMTRDRQDEAPLDVGDLRFGNVTEFEYHGCLVTSDNDTDYEVAARIQKGICIRPSPLQ